MKCRECGRETRVLATRSEGEGYLLRRTRVCSGEHRFTTYEIDDSLDETVIRHAMRPGRIGGLVAAAARHERDADIARRAAAGEKHAAIAVDYGLSHNMISTIARRAGVHSRRIAPSRQRETV